MQLGFVSAIVPELSLEEVVALAASIGYGCVELMCWPRGRAERRYAGITHVDAAGMTQDEAARINDVMLRHNVAISGLGYYPNPLAPDADEAQTTVEHIKAVIRAAALLEVGVVNTFIGRDWTKPLDENWPRFLETWRPLIAYAEDQGVKIAIENCPMLFTRDEWPGGKNLARNPAIWRRMFEDILSPNFGLNYDPSHMVWQQMDYLAPLREFKDRIFHVHAKDARLDRHKLDQVGVLAYPNEYHTPKLPGLGDVKWGQFFSSLYESGYRGPVCVEVEDRSFEGSLELRTLSLVQSHTYLRQYVSRDV